MIDLLIVLLRPALKAVEGGSKNPFHWLCAVVAWLVDIAIAHSSWALVAGWPKNGEWTISHTLERLCVDYQNPDHHLFVQIATKLNRVSPTGDHIKAVL